MVRPLVCPEGVPSVLPLLFTLCICILNVGIAQRVKNTNKQQKSLTCGHCPAFWSSTSRDSLTIGVGGTSWTRWWTFPSGMKAPLTIEVAFNNVSCSNRNPQGHTFVMIVMSLLSSGRFEIKSKWEVIHMTGRFMASLQHFDVKMMGSVHHEIQRFEGHIAPRGAPTQHVLTLKELKPLPDSHWHN